MKKKVIMAGAAVIMSAVAVGFGVNVNTNMTEFMSANLEALTQDETLDSYYCYREYDSPSWLVDDEYKRVCTDPSGQDCVMYEGHDFKAIDRCIPWA